MGRQSHPIVLYLNDRLADTQRAAPGAGPACLPLSALAQSQESAASAQARVLLRGAETLGQSEASQKREDTIRL